MVLLQGFLALVAQQSVVAQLTRKTKTEAIAS